MKLSDLEQQRAAKQAELDAIIETEETRSLEDREKERAGQLVTEIEEIIERSDRVRTRDDLDRRAAASRVGTGMPDYDRAVADFDVPGMIAYKANIEGASHPGASVEVSQELAKRGGNTGDGFCIPFSALLPKTERRIAWGGGSGTGAGLVFEQELPGGIPALRPLSLVAALGAPMVDGIPSGAPVGMSKITSGKTAEWIGEGGTGTVSGPNTGKVEMTPKRCISLTSMSNTMLVATSQSA